MEPSRAMESLVFGSLDSPRQFVGLTLRLCDRLFLLEVARDAIPHFVERTLMRGEGDLQREHHVAAVGASGHAQLPGTQAKDLILDVLGVGQLEKRVASTDR